MIIDLFLINKFPFFHENRMLFFFCQRVKYEDQKYIVDNFVLFSTSQIADVLPVIDKMIYAPARVFKIFFICRFDFYSKLDKRNLELQSYTMKFRSQVNSVKNIFE